MDKHGNFEGGGVCDECQDNTAGINCETCADGFFRAVGVLPNDTSPCQRKSSSFHPSLHCFSLPRATLLCGIIQSPKIYALVRSMLLLKTRTGCGDLGLNQDNSSTSTRG